MHDEFSRFFPRTRRSSLTDGSSPDLSKSLSATALLCEKYDNCFFFFQFNRSLKKSSAKPGSIFLGNIIWHGFCGSVDGGYLGLYFSPVEETGSLSSFLSLSLSLSLFLYNLRNTREVHRILLRFGRFRIRNFHEIVTKWGTQNKRHSDTETAEGFGWDTVTADHDHAKTSEKALTDTSKFGFYLRSFLPAWCRSDTKTWFVQNFKQSLSKIVLIFRKSVWKQDSHGVFQPQGVIVLNIETVLNLTSFLRRLDLEFLIISFAIR